MIIGITGLAGAGKDTAGKILNEVYGVELLAFATPLKEACRMAFGLTDEQLHGSLKETPSDTLCGRSPRQVMQWLGTDFAREMIGDDIWLRQAERRLPKGDVALTDCRFANEAQWILDRGGVVIEITRPSGLIEVPLHISEQGIPDHMIHSTISNSGNLLQLRERLVTVLDEVLEDVDVRRLPLV